MPEKIALAEEHRLEELKGGERKSSGTVFTRRVTHERTGVELYDIMLMIEWMLIRCGRSGSRDLSSHRLLRVHGCPETSGVKEWGPR